MAQSSIFWTTGTSGDGTSPYTQSQLFSWLRRSFLANPASEGVLNGWGGSLAVTGTSSPISVATGAAVVNGIPYENDAPVELEVPTPVIGTTGHRVVLRADYTARTVRIALLSSSDGVAAIPAVTQMDGTTWEISLATLTITTGGVITITDTRQYAHFRTAVDSSMLDSSAVTTAKIADNSVTTAKLANSAVTQAKLGSDTLRQLRIPIVTGTCGPASSSLAMEEVTDVHYGLKNSRTLINRDRLPAGATIRLVVLLHANSGSARTYLELYNATTGAVVAGSSIDTGVLPMNLTTVVASNSFAVTALAAGENQYVLRIRRDAGQTGSGAVHKAELIVQW